MESMSLKSNNIIAHFFPGVVLLFSIIFFNFNWNIHDLIIYILNINSSLLSVFLILLIGSLLGQVLDAIRDSF